MKVVDLSRHKIIKCGVDWPYNANPNCKHVITQLERNEALVSWLQPINGSVDDQFPAIRIHDKYYTMSLRMMKAIWRHVRLKRGFVNRETIPHVGVKLRIPAVLLTEKLRTQQRFNIMRQCSNNIGKTPDPAATLLGVQDDARGHGKHRMKGTGRASAASQNIKRRMDDILRNVILQSKPSSDITLFTVREEESLVSIVNQLKRDCPNMCQDVDVVVEKIRQVLVALR